MISNRPTQPTFSETKRSNLRRSHLMCEQMGTLTTYLLLSICFLHTALICSIYYWTEHNDDITLDPRQKDKKPLMLLRRDYRLVMWNQQSKLTRSNCISPTRTVLQQEDYGSERRTYFSCRRPRCDHPTQLSPSDRHTGHLQIKQGSNSLTKRASVHV